MAWLRASLWILVLAAVPGWAAGADCPERFRIAFADGTRGCLSDYALAREDATGHFASVRTTVPAHGYFALAVTPALPQCKRAVGLGSMPGTQLTPQLMAETEQRTQKALQDCRLRVLGAGRDCACRLILVDGRSPLSPAEFARYADAAKAVAAAASASPVPASAAAAGTSQAPAPTAADDIAALRQQVESLRSEVARARPGGAAPSTAAAPARKRVRALVIGNSRYAYLGALPNPKRDAEAIAAKLRSYGIDVDLHLDTDRPGLVRALTDFQARAVGVDVNLLFYAGHGLQVAGVNYIVPVDMKADGATVGSVKLNGISLDDALEYLPAPTRVVFLDACRDNPLARSLRSTRNAAGVGLAPMSTVSGTLLSYATRDGSTAEDGSGTNSPYTTALLRHLDVEEDIALVLRRVRQTVLEMTGQRQEPWEYGSLVGDQLVLPRLVR